MGRQHSRATRGWVLILVSTLGLLVLFLQLVNIQVLSHDHYFAMAEENRIRVTPIPPLRGRILDREGRLLASDRPSYTISIIPSEAKPLSELAGKLAPLLAMDADVIVEKVRQRRFRKYEPVRIKRDVDFGTVCIIEEAAELYPGVIYQLDHARHYHYGNIACHLLGHTGEVDDRERRSGYRLGSLIGRSGIERQYDQLLRGFEGVDYLEVSATGRIIGPLEEKQGREPIAGMELVLTIDLDLQRVADSLFGDTLTGAAVFIRPRSGEIVALVSKPTYDANLFSGLVPVSEYDNLIQDQGHPLFDRAISGTYPPGSTAKLLIAGAALQEGIITTASRFSPCFGGYQFGNRYFRCYDPSGHGSLDLYGAIEQSCDTYFYQLGLKVGLARWQEYALAAGFAAQSGIDIPVEKIGNVPNKDWYDRVYGRQGWTRAVMLNLAIGQGELLVTPLALAQFFCGLANKGAIMKPHLLQAFQSPGGQITSFEPKITRRLPFSKEVIQILKDACVLVVEGEHGTARGSKIPGMKWGGKTGTAQNPHGNEHSWFVGFAPAENPEIVGCVIVEQAGHGSAVAAPFVREIMIRYFEKAPRVRQSLANAAAGGTIVAH